MLLGCRASHLQGGGACTLGACYITAGSGYNAKICWRIRLHLCVVTGLLPWSLLSASSASLQARGACPGRKLKDLGPFSRRIQGPRERRAGQRRSKSRKSHSRSRSQRCASHGVQSMYSLLRHRNLTQNLEVLAVAGPDGPPVTCNCQTSYNSHHPDRVSLRNGDAKSLTRTGCRGALEPWCFWRNPGQASTWLTCPRHLLICNASQAEYPSSWCRQTPQSSMAQYRLASRLSWITRVQLAESEEYRSQPI